MRRTVVYYVMITKDVEVEGHLYEDVHEAVLQGYEELKELLRADESLKVTLNDREVF